MCTCACVHLILCVFTYVQEYFSNSFLFVFIYVYLHIYAQRMLSCCYTRQQCVLSLA